MAQMAGIAYLDGKEAAKEYEKLGYTKHKFFEKDGAQCHAVWNDRRYVLCFRGTEPDELSDVLADLNAFPDKGIMGGYVHNGFQNEVEKVFGLASKARLKELLDEEAILITTEDKKGEDMKGKFGRILGDFRVGGRTVSEILIEEGHAVAYHGESKDDVQAQHMINRQRLIAEGKVDL